MASRYALHIHTCMHLYVKFIIHIILHTTGKSETKVDMLRSVFAQLDYSYQINRWDSLGVPFKTHLHVPERHPDIDSVFCERVDEDHVFKVFKFMYG